MPQLLLIQNHGEAPIEAYTTLGYSSSRNSDVEGIIGQFGTGNKLGITLCLRAGLPVWVYCGNTRLEFKVEPDTVDDMGDTPVNHVVYRKGGAKKWTRTGWTLDWGAIDWTNVGMALREFISNAIDRTLKDGGENNLSVKIVDESDRRAKAGVTRVFVEANDEVREYFGQLGKRFLHFSDNPDEAKPQLLHKRGRNITGKGAMIYREGVLIRELAHYDDSEFDYNFAKGEIAIDESRNMGDYQLKLACSQKLGSADAATLSRVFRNELSGVKTFESSFDQDVIFGGYYREPSEEQKETWSQAWEAAAGEDAVVCDNKFSLDYVEKKGHKARAVISGWAKSISKVVKSADDVLTTGEKSGREKVPATHFAEAALDWAWDLVELLGLNGQKEKPQVFCFKQLSSAASQTHGYADSEGVHFHLDIANDGVNNELKKTALEEVAHWVTGATDNSRDFQNFFIDAIVAMA
jgi:hypothetical protein